MGKIVKFYFRKIDEVGNIRELSDCIRFYRSIHLLEKSFNVFLMHRVLPSFMMAATGIQIIGLYVCIMHHSEISATPGLLVFPLLGVDGMICNILIFTMASLVEKASTEALQRLGRKSRKLGDKSWGNRELKSLTFMSVRFGSNFIDRGTPLNIQTFCINQTMSLCLINSGHDTQ